MTCVQETQNSEIDITFVRGSQNPFVCVNRSNRRRPFRSPFRVPIIACTCKVSHRRLLLSTKEYREDILRSNDTFKTTTRSTEYPPLAVDVAISGYTEYHSVKQLFDLLNIRFKFCQSILTNHPLYPIC
jgi:hypothetical protein